MADRVVVKVGSSTLTGPEGRLDEEYMRSLASQIAEVRSSGAQVTLVSSGAIAAGMGVLGLASRPRRMSELQAAAAVGQVQLVKTYSRLFAEHDVVVGQVLLTRHETTHRQQYVLACNTLEKLLEMGAVPIVNENDTTAVEEIAFGDNDSLAALVAIMTKSELVVMLTDIEGLHTSDPRRDADARLVTRVDDLTDDLIVAAGGPGSRVGSGGMASKMEAAKTLKAAGIPMVLCDGRKPGVIPAAVAGEPVGTFFAAGDAKVAGRKLWIAFARKPKGSIVVDDGARAALVEANKSLLAAGVVDVKGDFEPGDSVTIEDTDGRVLAKGLAGIGSTDLRRVRGMRTEQVREVLGGSAVPEAVHRDHLVIL
ncbi:MAG: glutamate 5-kinase [Coriobacteriia bacterium]